MPRSPMRDGWRVLQRSPGVVAAEIVWRWTFGAAFWWLLIVSFHAYFSTIEISSAEYQLMKSLEPYTWTAVAVRVLTALITGIRAMGPILVPALSLLWIVLATIGRAVTVRELSAGRSRTSWVSLALLHVFRVLMTLAAVLAYFGAGAIVGSVFDQRTNFALDFLLMSVVLMALSAIWSLANWFLSVAAIFPSRDGAGIRQSFIGAADLYHAGIGRASIAFSLIRAALVFGSTFASLIFAALMMQGHRRGSIAGIIVVSLLYFALVDSLYVWRLASYISMTEPEVVAQLAPQINLMLNEGAGPSEAPQEPMNQQGSEPTPPPTTDFGY